jgi:hypothetical protein
MNVLKEKKLSPLIERLKITCFITSNNQVVIIPLNHDRTPTQSVKIRDPNHDYLTLTLLPESIQTFVYNFVPHP